MGDVNHNRGREGRQFLHSPSTETQRREGRQYTVPVLNLRNRGEIMHRPTKEEVMGDNAQANQRE